MMYLGLEITILLNACSNVYLVFWIGFGSVCWRLLGMGLPKVTYRTNMIENNILSAGLLANSKI